MVNASCKYSRLLGRSSWVSNSRSTRLHAVGVDVGVEKRRDPLERRWRLHRIGSGELEKDLVAASSRAKLVDISGAVEDQVVGLVRPASDWLDLQLGPAALAEAPLQLQQLLVVVGESLVSKGTHRVGL